MLILTFLTFKAASSEEWGWSWPISFFPKGIVHACVTVILKNWVEAFLGFCAWNKLKLVMVECELPRGAAPLRKHNFAGNCWLCARQNADSNQWMIWCEAVCCSDAAQMSRLWLWGPHSPENLLSAQQWVGGVSQRVAREVPAVPQHAQHPQNPEGAHFMFAW